MIRVRTSPLSGVEGSGVEGSGAERESLRVSPTTIPGKDLGHAGG